MKEEDSLSGVKSSKVCCPFGIMFLCLYPVFGITSKAP
jgi:hypothetical protein